MDMFDRDTLVTLASHTGWPSVSMYLPTHRSGAEKEQDRIRLKNLCRSTCDRLVDSGMRPADVDSFCGRVLALVDDPSFWRDTQDGLAIFMSSDLFEIMKLDAQVPEHAVAGDRFYLRPLMAAHRGDQRFFALAIDRNGSRLFRGDGASIEQVVLDGVPASLADELRFDETQQSIQYSSVPAPAQAAGGGRPTGAIFHGHGGEKDTDKINLERYLRKVEAAVSKICAAETPVPLVLLGVDYEVAAYRALSSCPALASECVIGATDELTPYKIHAAVLQALEPRFAAMVQTELMELTEKEGSSLASHDLVEIVSAAAAGRVKTLFFDDGVGPFGTFDRDAFTVEALCADAPRFLREGAQPMDSASTGDCGWDLIDLAAAETALHGGDVHAFTGEDAPVHGVAAVFRY